MLLDQHFLLLGEVLQLQIDIASLSIITRVETIHFHAQLGDALFIGADYLIGMTV